MTLIDQYLEYIHEQTLTMMWMGAGYSWPLAQRIRKQASMDADI